MKLLPLTLVLAAPLAHAQVRIAGVHGDQQWEWVGWAVGGLDDMDGDGYPEFFSAAPHDVTGVGEEGSVSVFSGLDGSLRYKLAGFPDHGDVPFGWSAAVVGDLDLDGFDDFAVGYPDDGTFYSHGGSVRVFSGLDGTELLAVYGDHEWHMYGYNVGAAGDVDADGIPDVIVGSLIDGTVATQAGMAQVFSGADGAVLHTWWGSVSFGKFGSAVAGAGDVDGDGFGDLIVGAEAEGPGVQTGRAYVYSGADGSLIHQWQGTSTFSLFGHSVSSLGDVDGDGRADVAVGAPQGDYVRVYSGSSGALLYELSAPSTAGPWGFGMSLAGRSDLDGDGTRDLFVGSAEAARVYGHSGVDGALIFAIDGDVPGFLGGDYGWSVDVAPPVAGPNVPTLVVGAIGSTAGGPPGGSVLLYAMDVFWKSYCSTSPNSVGPGATIGMNGDLSITTNDTRLEASGCPPGQFAVFYYGPERFDLPFGEGRRCVGGHVYRLEVFSTGATGTPTYLLDLSNPPEEGGTILPGSRWRFQCWYRDPAGGGAAFNLSDALEAWFKL